VKGWVKETVAVYTGLSLVWRNGPTAGLIHRFKLLQRQAYGRAGVDFLRPRLLASSAGAAAYASGRRAIAAVWS
jgi:transposase